MRTNLLRTDRHVGRFRIGGRMFDHLTREELHALFGQMIVLRADFHPRFDGFEYEAISFLFAEVEEYTIPPMYTIVYWSHEKRFEAQLQSEEDRVRLVEIREAWWTRVMRQLRRAQEILVGSLSFRRGGPKVDVEGAGVGRKDESYPTEV